MCLVESVVVLLIYSELRGMLNTFVEESMVLVHNFATELVTEPVVYKFQLELAVTIAIWLSTLLSNVHNLVFKLLDLMLNVQKLESKLVQIYGSSPLTISRMLDHSDKNQVVKLKLVIIEELAYKLIFEQLELKQLSNYYPSTIV